VRPLRSVALIGRRPLGVRLKRRQTRCGVAGYAGSVRTACSRATRRVWGACPRGGPAQRSRRERAGVDSDRPPERATCARWSHRTADRRADRCSASARGSVHGARPTTEKTRGRSSTTILTDQRDAHDGSCLARFLGNATYRPPSRPRRSCGAQGSSAEPSQVVREDAGGAAKLELACLGDAGGVRPVSPANASGERTLAQLTV
jgi:hypothetical protein